MEDMDSAPSVQVFTIVIAIGLGNLITMEKPVLLQQRDHVRALDKPCCQVAMWFL